jgi:hypothetical protein
MNKALQAKIDSILLAAGTVELGSANYMPIAPLVRSLPRGTQASPIERDRDAQVKATDRPERIEHKQAL